MTAAFMPPLLSSSGGSFDCDYDSVQPYFLCDAEEEALYPPPRSQPQPGPGEDIWKKFELLPTPPLSPGRRASVSRGPPRELRSDPPGDEPAGHGFLRDPSRRALLRSCIVQDCMWSGFSAAARLQEAVSERLASLRAGQPLNARHPQDPAARAPVRVDPSEVFPFPLSDVRKPGRAARERAADQQLDTPPHSSSSESEEEQEEEEEEEEEEEVEIDVVTVERRRRPGVSLKRRLESAGPAERRGGGARSRRSPQASGGEDKDKRRTHNVLERRRRTELKRSFLSLRAQVPQVAHNHRAAKVLILNKASECIMGMRTQQQRLVAVKEQLRRRKEELEHRLQLLRSTSTSTD